MKKFMTVLLAVLMGAGVTACGNKEDVLKDAKPYPVNLAGNCHDGYTIQVDKRAPSGIAEVILKDNGENNALWWITLGNKVTAVTTLTIGQSPAGYTTRTPLASGALTKARRLWIRGEHDNDEFTGVNELELKCS